jgi:uncharacterized membrane protein AbrB (regulator of aidB expression)
VRQYRHDRYVIPPDVADTIRWASAIGCLVLGVSAGMAIRYSGTPDQRVNYGIFVLISVVLITGQVAALGATADYRLPLVTAVVAAALWSTITYVRRERARHRER